MKIQQLQTISNENDSIEALGPRNAEKLSFQNVEAVLHQVRHPDDDEDDYIDPSSPKRQRSD